MYVRDRALDPLNSSRVRHPVDSGRHVAGLWNTLTARTLWMGVGPRVRMPWGLLGELSACYLGARGAPAARHDHAREGVVAGAARDLIVGGVPVVKAALYFTPHEHGLDVR